MGIAALVISVLALVAATAAAVYARAQAVTAERGVQLSSEGQPVPEKTRAAAVSGGGQPRTGGAALVGIRNHGSPFALQVTLTDPTGKEHTLGAIKPDQFVQV